MRACMRGWWVGWGCVSGGVSDSLERRLTNVAIFCQGNEAAQNGRLDM